MATPKQTDPQFKLRMTYELRKQIEEAAKANNRSMNAEIVERLEASFRFGVGGFFGVTEAEAQLAQEIRNLRQDLFSLRHDGLIGYPHLDKK